MRLKTLMYLCHTKQTNVMTIETLNLSQLEEKVLDAFIAQLYSNIGVSDVQEKDLVKVTKLSEIIVRGMLLALMQKGIVRVENHGENTIIFLCEEYWDLHPRWSVEKEWSK